MAYPSKHLLVIPPVKANVTLRWHPVESRSQQQAMDVNSSK